jgi:Mrp family chromosome partitioning ATPase
VVLAAVVAVGAVYVYTRSRVASYQSEAAILLTSSTGAPSTSTFVLSPTEPDVIASAASFLHTSPAKAAGLAGAVSYSLDPTSGLVSVVGTSPVPQEALDVTSAFAEAYVSVMHQQTVSQLTVLQGELSSLAARIRALSPSRIGAAVSPLKSEELNVASQSYGSVESQIVALETAPPPASIYAAPSAPAKSGTSKKKLVVLGGVAGLLVGIGIVLILGRFDTRVHSATDVASEVPVLAELPYQPKLAGRRAGPTAIPVADAPGSLIADRVRELRTSLQSLLGNRSSTVVLVTSSEVGDGKSFLVANLAASWALAGRRVVAVSTDLRRPQLDTVLAAGNTSGGLASLVGASLPGAPPGAGAEQAVAEPVDSAALHVDPLYPNRVASGTVDPHPASGVLPVERPRAARRGPGTDAVLAALVPTRIAGLFVLPAGGKGALDPGDLLASDAMRRVIGELERSFDVVVVDTPALAGVSDAGALAGHADVVLVVARAHRTDQKTLRDTVARLVVAGARTVGVVLNLTSPVRAVQSPYRPADDRAGGGAGDIGLRRMAATDTSSRSA